MVASALLFRDQKFISYITSPPPPFPGTDSKATAAAILNRADIVFATLNGCGSARMESLNLGSRKFDMAVCDEAAQAQELDAIIPMRFGVKRFILVGDPKQLPATVLSRESCV